ncbi:MAG: metal-dependent hydrolase [Acidobacteriota bacterium]
MDVISHALWGYIAIAGMGKVEAGIAAAIGTAPDVIAFAPVVLTRSFWSKYDYNNPDRHIYPGWIHTMYNTTHSLVVFSIVFTILWFAVSRVAAIVTLAWLLHILMDIPTHSKDFFPTKILYPLSEIHFNGVPWSTPWILGINGVLLLVVGALRYFNIF